MEDRSEKVEELVAALVKAQTVFLPIPRTKHVKYSNVDYHYADLADIMTAIRAPLTEAGLAVSHQIDGLHVKTTLFHISGQWVSSALKLEQDVNAQALGSDITYKRRYGLSAILGLVTETDDDGKASMDAHQKRKAALSKPKQAKLEPQTGKLSKEGLARLVASKLKNGVRLFDQAVEESITLPLDGADPEAWLGDKVSQMACVFFQLRTDGIQDAHVDSFVAAMDRAFVTPAGEVCIPGGEHAMDEGVSASTGTDELGR